MIPSNGKSNSTLYEQVLDFARKEIEDASSQMEELRRALHLVEARVEAAKSVYESVAARLNLEDELEDEAQLDHTKFPTLSSELPQTSPPEPQVPPVQAAPQQPVAQPESPRVEPPVFAPEPQQTPEPPPASKAVEPPVFAPEPAEQAPEPPPVQPSAPQQPAEAPAASNGNGSADGFSMDLIRKHLEAREKAAQAASQAPTWRATSQSEAPSEQPAPKPAQAQAPPPPPPPAQKPATETPAASQPAQGGFPGLSEADRALIGEYLRSKRDG